MSENLLSSSFFSGRGFSYIFSLVPLLNAKFLHSLNSSPHVLLNMSCGWGAHTPQAVAHRVFREWTGFEAGIQSESQPGRAHIQQILWCVYYRTCLRPIVQELLFAVLYAHRHTRTHTHTYTHCRRRFLTECLCYGLRGDAVSRSVWLMALVARWPWQAYWHTKDVYKGRVLTRQLQGFWTLFIVRFSKNGTW
jgi:hypothetical protein